MPPARRAPNRERTVRNSSRLCCRITPEAGVSARDLSRRSEVLADRSPVGLLARRRLAPLRRGPTLGRLCDSAAHAGPRTKAVVPGRGRARLDLGESDYGPRVDAGSRAFNPRPHAASRRLALAITTPIRSVDNRTFDGTEPQPGPSATAVIGSAGRAVLLSPRSGRGSGSSRECRARSNARARPVSQPTPALDSRPAADCRKSHNAGT